MNVSFNCLSDLKNGRVKIMKVKDGLNYTGLRNYNSMEAKEYFKNFNLVTYLFEKEEDIKSINLAFSQLIIVLISEKSG